MEEIKNYVTDLPEIYQNIYGHPEYDNLTSRKCREREAVIKTIIADYQKFLGKKSLKVLDLGCAQGYYSFALAEIGCKVDGIDFLDKNVALCNALQKENKLSCNFRIQEINMQMIDSIKDDTYDVILFFSVVHHIANKNGFNYALNLFSKLAKKATFVLTELAVKSEPVYWNKKLPVDYEDWFSKVSFYKEMAFFATHLSEIERPFIFFSDKICYIKNKFYTIYEYLQSPHSGRKTNGTNRYYICDEKTVLLKVFRKKNNSSSIVELETEANFIQNNHDLSFVPKFLDIEENDHCIALLTQIHYGETLRNIKKNASDIDLYRTFLNVLDCCVKLEERGFYQGDMRAWNICVDNTENAFIIDFGSIQMHTIDSLLQWSYKYPDMPITVYDAFFALLYDYVHKGSNESIRKYGNGVYLPTFKYNLDDMPPKYAHFFKRFLALEPRDISFSHIKELFENMDTDNYVFSESEEDRIRQKLRYGEYLSNGLDHRKWYNRIKWIKSRLWK